MANWNPIEKPYRVRKIRQNGGYGMYGWSDSVATFATFKEAEAEVLAPMKGGNYEAELDYAENGADWNRSGKWVRLASRKIKKTIAYSRRAKDHR